MSANRWFNILVVPMLVILLALTIEAGYATATLAFAAPSASVCARPVINPTSIHGQLVSDLGMVVAQSDVAPTGVDGGLMALLSDYRSCSK